MNLKGKSFENARLGMEIYVYEIEGEEWFVGKDMVKLLGYSEKSKPLRKWGEMGSVVWEENKKKIYVKTLENIGKCLNNTSEIVVNNNIIFVNECGLYQLVFGSTLDNAVEFQKWIFSEVLPSLRKNNYYIDNENITDNQKDLAISELLSIRENGENLLLNNPRRALVLQSCLEDMFPSVSDIYQQFLDTMVISGTLNDKYYPTEAFKRLNKEKGFFKYNETIFIEKEAKFTLTNKGINHLIQTLRVVDGKLGAVKVGEYNAK